MKNTENREGKTKHIARIMLLILLLSSAINLAGCGSTPQIKKGQYYTISLTHEHDIKLAVASYTKEFDLNDVTLQMYVGLHKKSYSLIDWLINDKNDLLYKTYDVSEIPDYNEKLYYVICVENVNSEDLKNYENKDNNIWEGVHVYKEISYKDSLKDGKYNWIISPILKDSYFNHSEKITFPKEYFVEGGYNYIYITIYLVEKLDNDGMKYSDPIDGMWIRFHYQITDKGTVILDYLNKK